MNNSVDHEVAEQSFGRQWLDPRKSTAALIYDDCHYTKNTKQKCDVADIWGRNNRLAKDCSKTPLLKRHFVALRDRLRLSAFRNRFYAAAVRSAPAANCRLRRENNVFILVQGQKCVALLLLLLRPLPLFLRLTDWSLGSTSAFWFIRRTEKRSILALKVKSRHFMHASIPNVGIKWETRSVRT